MPIVDSIYRNPNRWRAVINTRDVRHGTAGCLLSLVLLAPLFVRQFGMVTIATAVLTYSLFIVPAVTNYFSPIKIIMKISRKLAEVFKRARSKFTYDYLQSTMVKFQSFAAECIDGASSVCILCLHLVSLPVFCLVFCFIPAIHDLYVTIDGFRVTTNQIVFLFLCEKSLAPEARMAALHFILFYAVLAYIHKSLLTRRWSVSFHTTNIQDFFKMTSWFVVLRLAKGVTMAFVMMIFTAQFNHIEPNVTFICVTFVYFIMTQKKWSGDARIVSFFKYLQIDVLEEDEDFWIPFCLKAMPIGASVVPILLLLGRQNFLCLIAVYTNCYVPFIRLKRDFDDRLIMHSVCLLSFRRASKEDLEKNPTCPVCLDVMRVARVTPCNHVYHAICLRKCLAVTYLCPLCKRPLS